MSWLCCRRQRRSGKKTFDKYVSVIALVDVGLALVDSRSHGVIGSLIDDFDEVRVFVCHLCIPLVLITWVFQTISHTQTRKIDFNDILASHSLLCHILVLQKDFVINGRV